MFLSFPLLCAALMLLVHVTVQLVPRTIREHHVSYRPIRTHLADLRLILRLLIARRKDAALVPSEQAYFSEGRTSDKTAAVFS